MKVIRQILAQQHKCAESQIEIISPKELPEVEESTVVEVEYEVNGKTHTAKVNVEPPIDVGSK